MERLPETIVVILLQVILGTLSQREECLLPHIENGRSRATFGGRNIRLGCRKEFQLMGPKYAHCVRGAWDVEMPVCVKPGCPRFTQQFVKGIFYESYRGAFVKVLCDQGYAVNGSTAVYCNGRNWNDTFPICQAKIRDPLRSCAFEDQNICGWTSFSLSSSGWMWTSALDVSDSLLDANNSRGSFMLLTTTGKAASTLFSPVFSPSLSGFVLKLSCYVRGNGTMKVFVKQEGRSLLNTIPILWFAPPYSKGWVEVSKRINVSTFNFQIVIQASGSRSVFAIDDFYLLTVNEFTETTSWMTTTDSSAEEQVTDAFDTKLDFTCFERCGNSAVLNGTKITSIDIGEPPKCDCLSSCMKANFCCNDYEQFCRVPSTKTASTEKPVSIGTSSSTPRVKPTTPQMIFTTISSKSTVHQIINSTELTRLKTTKSIYPTKASSTKFITKSITPNTSLAINTTKAIKIFVTTSIPTVQTTKRKPTTAAISTIIKTTRRVATTPKTTRMAFTTKMLPHVLKSTTLRVNKLTTTVKLIVKPTELTNNIPVMGNYPKQQKINYPIPTNGKTLYANPPRGFKETDGSAAQGSVLSPPNETINIEIPVSTIIEVSAGAIVLFCVILSIGMFFFRRRHRRLLEYDNGMEDCDVRFLTSDEALDFSLAKPSDMDL